MTPMDPWSADAEDMSQQPIAPEEIQRDIASMLRQSARAESPSPRMPDDVAANIMAEMSALGLAQRGVPDGTPSTPASAQERPSTMIPLPWNGPRSTASHEGRTSSSPDSPARSSDAGSSHQPVSAAPSAETSTGPAPAPGSVHSLDAHRNKKRGFSRTALSLGAAAAVALGALGVWQGTSGGSDTHRSTAAGSPGAGSPDVRVTNSETAYTGRSFTNQASELSAQKQPAITSSAEAQRRGLGALATKQGLETCVSALNSVLGNHPDKIYADFGTYDGQPSVIVVVVKDGKKTAWAVNRTCTKESDARTAPHPLET